MSNKLRFALIVRDSAGNAAVEFSLLLPILLLLVAGAWDFGQVVRHKLLLQSAVHTGLHYAMQNQGRDLAYLAHAIEHALSPIESEVEVNMLCRCSGGTTACSGSCHNPMQQFVSVSARLSYSTWLFQMDLPIEAAFSLYVGNRS